MSLDDYKRIVLTHWNAGVFHFSTRAQVLPELLVYSLLYDEVLIREEDLITNRAITKTLSEPRALGVFAELLTSGIVKLLRVPPDLYPSGRQYDPLRLPISARVEEHSLRRTYKGKPWKPTHAESDLFRYLDGVVANHPSASRFHAPFPTGNPFAAHFAEILENRHAYRLKSHPAFSRLDPETADHFVGFCRDPEAWLRFLRARGITKPIIGPDAGFYRSAAYQCAKLLPTPRAIRRLIESVYAAAYCERESADGRYGGSELVELPYRYASEVERAEAADEALRIELAPTGAAAGIVVQPETVSAILRTRQTPEFAALRRAIRALDDDATSPLLVEGRFNAAWRDLCAVYSEHLAFALSPSGLLDHLLVKFLVVAYVYARVEGFRVVPCMTGVHFDPIEEAVSIAAMEVLGPRMLRGARALLKIPAIRERMESSVSIVRCGAVPLS